MNNDGFDHLIPLVNALIEAGNPLAEGKGPGVFQLNQGGPCCVLDGPLHFEAVRDLPRRQEVFFDEPNDFIACSHCWALIRGGRYLAARNRQSRS